MTTKPYAFFYGGYMNPDTLRAYGTTPEDCEVGYVEGLELTIGPIANMAPKEGARAYGLLARLSHKDLDKLYGGDPAALKGSRYLPEAVLVQTANGSSVPAMTYLCSTLSGAVPEAQYVANLVKAAEVLNLPAAYIAQIKAFIDPAQ